MTQDRIFRCQLIRPLISVMSLVSLLVCISHCSNGNSCRANADCANSEAAHAIAQVKCEFKEVYCLNDTCHGQCRSICIPVRTDVNPCDGGAVCAAANQYGNDFCTMLPVQCSSVADCPEYLPPMDGGISAWSCDDGVCTNPAWTYATH